MRKLLDNRKAKLEELATKGGPERSKTICFSNNTRHNSDPYVKKVNFGP